MMKNYRDDNLSDGGNRGLLVLYNNKIEFIEARKV